VRLRSNVTVLSFFTSGSKYFLHYDWGQSNTFLRPRSSTGATRTVLPPVDYPVVPQDQVRFRASVTALRTPEYLDEVLNIIEDTVIRGIGKRA
jgi:7-keto-8-aminopelargonate synthetase-like enzyme